MVSNYISQVHAAFTRDLKTRLYARWDLYVWFIVPLLLATAVIAFSKNISSSVILPFIVAYPCWEIASASIIALGRDRNFFVNIVLGPAKPSAMILGTAISSALQALVFTAILASILSLQTENIPFSFEFIILVAGSIVAALGITSLFFAGMLIVRTPEFLSVILRGAFLLFACIPFSQSSLPGLLSHTGFIFAPALLTESIRFPGTISSELLVASTVAATLWITIGLATVTLAVRSIRKNGINWTTAK